MKILTIDGRVGRNGAEIKQTNGGVRYMKFSMANNSYSNGKETTEWYDVTSFDQNFIDKLAQYITKGKYLIVTGNIKSEVKIGNDGNVWLNHNIRATNIDFPSGGNSQSNHGNDAEVSTYTGNTPSSKIVQETAQAAPVQQSAPVQQVAPIQEPAPSTMPFEPPIINSGNDDDLPF